MCSSLADGLHRYLVLPSQLALLPSNKLLHLRKSVVVIQALRIRQRTGWLDDLPRDDLLDWKLNFLKVDGRLRKSQSPED